jgi:hypothetical protein
MANIRNIKKDIDYLVGEVLSDCYTFMYLYPDKKREEAVAVLQEAVALHNRLSDRVRHIEGPARAHFRAISGDLLKGVDSLFGRISELTK